MSDCCNLSYRFSNEVLEYKIIMNIIMIVQYLTTRKVEKGHPNSLLESADLYVSLLSLCVSLSLRFLSVSLSL